MRTWRILAQVIACDFCCFSQRALHGVHIPCGHRSVVRWGGHMRCPCVYCLCLADQASFSTRAPVQSLTNQRKIDPYFKSQIYVVDLGHRMGWVNPGSERTTEINFFRGWDSNRHPLDQQSSVIPPDHHRCGEPTMNRDVLNRVKLTLWIELPFYTVSDAIYIVDMFLISIYQAK